MYTVLLHEMYIRDSSGAFSKQFSLFKSITKLLESEVVQIDVSLLL